MRKIDTLGRVVIPKDWRDEIGLEEGTEIEITKVGDKIIIEKYEVGCTICGKSSDLFLKIKDKKICSKCLNEIEKFRFND